MYLPRLVIARWAHRKADIEAQRPNRCGIRRAHTKSKTQIVNGHVERAEGYLTKIHEDNPANLLKEFTAQLHRSLKQTPPPHWIIRSRERAQPMPFVAAHTVRSTGVEAFEHGHLFPASPWRSE